jgi:hypothetical protein
LSTSSGPEDRILQALVRKTETIKKELGSLSQVIDAKLAKSLQHGIRRSAIDELESDISGADLDASTRQTVETELEAARLPMNDSGERVDPSDARRRQGIRQQIDKLRDIVNESKASIGLDEDHFRSAITSALELLKVPGLSPVKSAEKGPPRAVFPAIDQLPGADPTWVETMDSLRKPRERDEKFWDWRRNSPIRPIVLRTRVSSPTTSFICTSNIASYSGCSAGSPRRASCITTCPAPASPRRLMAFPASSCSVAFASMVLALLDYMKN